MVSQFFKLLRYLWAPCLISFSINATGPLTDVFDSLSKIEQYAKLVDEYPNPDNNDWENPDFSTHYSHLLSGKFYKTLKLSGGFKSLWTAKGFKSLLEYVTHEREYCGYLGRFVTKTTPVPDTRMIIFGEMHGAFHSLVRDLHALKQIGYIDDSLKIINPDYYIVFNGNISSRSSYILETFTVILRLMYVNPYKVIFIRGSQEDKERWGHYSLKNELRMRASSIDDAKVPLNNLVNKFFNTLPLAFYLVASQTEKNIDVVRISNYGADIKELFEKEFADFFTHGQVSTSIIEEGSRRKSSVDINLRAIIRGEQFYKSQYVPSTGLQMSGKEEGATSWVIMSSPSQAYQELFQFYYDAFVMLTTYKALDDWTLTLYNSDVRESEPIRQTKVFKLVSGIELTSSEAIQSQLKSYQERTSFLENKIASLDQALNSFPVTQQKHELTGGLVGKKIVVRQQEKPAVVKESVAAKELPKKAEAKSIDELVATEIPMGSDKGFITVGTLVDLSNGTKEEGESIVQGIRAVFDLQNEQGGIEGKKLRLEVKDTRYTEKYARIGAENLLTQDKIDIVLAPLGTVSLEGFIDKNKKRITAYIVPSSIRCIDSTYARSDKYFLYARQHSSRGICSYKICCRGYESKKDCLFL